MNIEKGRIGFGGELRSVFEIVENAFVGCITGVVGVAVVYGYMVPWFILSIMAILTMVLYFMTSKPYGSLIEQILRINKSMLVGGAIGVGVGILGLESLHGEIDLRAYSYSFTMVVFSLVAIVTGWTIGILVREGIGIFR